MVLGFVAFLLISWLVIFLVLKIPRVQLFLKNLVINAIEDNLEAEVSIGEFWLGFPDELNVENIFVSAAKADTLVYVGQFAVSIELWPLLKKEISLDRVLIKDAKGYFGELVKRIPTDTNSVKQKSDNPWTFSINELLLEESYINYKDEQEGFKLVLDIGSVNIFPQVLDFDSLISLKSVDISKTDISFQWLSAQTSDDSATSFADIFIQEASLYKSGFDYIDSASAMLFSIKGDKIITDGLLVDISNENVSFNKGLIVQSSFSLKFLPEIDTVPANDEYLNWGQYLWGVRGHQLDIDTFRFVLKNENEQPLKGHFDNNHMDIYNVKGQILDLTVDEDTLVMQINGLSAAEGNGLIVESLDARLQQEGSYFNIGNLKMITSNAFYGLDFNTNISPTNYQKLDGKDLNIDLNIESKNWNDIDFFYALDSTDVSDTFLQENFVFTTKVAGGFDSISIEAMSLAVADSIKLDIRGVVNKLLDTSLLTFDIDLNEIMISKQELEKLAPNMLPDSVSGLPNYIELSGHCSGNTSSIVYSGTIKSDVGLFDIALLQLDFSDTMDIATKFTARLVNITVSDSNNISNAYFWVNTSFRGNDFYSAQLDFEMGIDSFVYHNYNYKNLRLIANSANGMLSSGFYSNDSNLTATLTAEGLLENDRQQIDFALDIVKFNLSELNFYENELIINGKYTALFENVDSGDFSIDFNLLEMTMFSVDTVLKAEPIELKFLTNDKESSFSLFGENNNLEVNAITPLNQLLLLPGKLSDISVDSFALDTYIVELPTFSIKGDLTYPYIIANLFDLPSFKELTVDGIYQKETDQLNASVEISDFNYAPVNSNALEMKMYGSSSELNYLIVAGFGGSNENASKLKLGGEIKDSEISCNLRYFDELSNQFINLTALVERVGASTKIHIVSDSLIINYNNWSVNGENELRLIGSKIYTQEFSVFSNDKLISIKSDSAQLKQDLQIEFADIDIGALEHILQLDTIVDGTASGMFTILDVFDDVGLEGGLTVDSISIFGFEARELRLENLILNKNFVKGNIFIEGDGDDISIAARYSLNGTDSINTNVDIGSLDLQDLNYLLSDYIHDADGFLEGNISVGGTVNKPNINGRLNFKNASIGIVELNNYFTLGNESITIVDNLIDFGSLSVENKNGKQAKLIGQISLSPENGAVSNLSLVTENMEIMNTTKDDSDVLFGFLEAKTNMKLTGPFGQLKLDVNVEIDKSTNVTYIFPEDLSINDNSGVVRFRAADSDTVALNLEEEIPHNEFFLDYSMFKDINTDVIVDEGAFFHLFFDGGGHDYLEASINGKLHYDLYEDATNISGMFIVDEGKLHYSIPMVTVSDFDIEQGSYIAVSNDLSNPTLNIIASSEIRASTEGLLLDYDKVMKFKVLLYMTGELNNLKLKFDISTETKDAIVSARLTQLSEQERNINALNLLVRGAFLITVNGNEAGSTSMINAQIDKFYANQLNHLISENIKFVDLHFDVQSFSDYNIEGSQIFRRNYYYNIGKTFLKDRARINYKGSLSLASDLEGSQLNTSFLENELTMEYKLNKKGSISAVLFRKNKYQGLLEGEIIETGGGFQFRKSFYKFKDIFNWKKSVDNYSEFKMKE